VLVPVASAMERHSPAPRESTFTVPVLAHLTVHIAEASVSKKKATRKEVKMKEFNYTFCSTKANYVQLLNTILEKHHISGKFQASERHRFSCKIQVPPAKHVDCIRV
jgi:hypothetical protein